jgi:hypothetical protein
MSEKTELTEKEKYAQELVAYTIGERLDCPKEPKPQENKCLKKQ